MLARILNWWRRPRQPGPEELALRDLRMMWRDRFRSAWGDVLDEGDYEDWSVLLPDDRATTHSDDWPWSPAGVTVVYAVVRRDSRFRTAGYVVACAKVSESVEPVDGPNRHPEIGGLVITADQHTVMAWRCVADVNDWEELPAPIDELLTEIDRQHLDIALDD